MHPVGECEQVAVTVAFADYVGAYRHAGRALNTGMEIAGTCRVVQMSASFALPVVLRPTRASPVEQAVSTTSKGAMIAPIA